MTTTPAMAAATGGTAGSQFASPIGQDRLIRKEVSLGAIREIPLPEAHVGIAQIAPWLNVESDDVIFDYIKDGLSTGLAPQRAEDAEAELAQKDGLAYGQGRAAIVDWSLKDKYTASDVTRYRQNLLIQQQVQGISADLNLADPGRMVSDFQSQLARDDTRRRRSLDNRLEWLIWQAIGTGQIAYNDGKIKWAVNFGRPSNQSAQQPASAFWDAGVEHDPIGDILAMNNYMYETYGVRLRRAYTSEKVLQTLWKSDRFTALTGLVSPGGAGATKIDINYLMPGWSPQAAIAAVEAATGVTFQVYDSVYRTRPIGSQTVTNNRFSNEKLIHFLPAEGDLEVDDTQLGFGKTLTSPHPEGNWSSGYYEWEQDYKDPWMTVRGSGVKAFPVFPYMEYTYTMQALA